MTTRPRKPEAWRVDDPDLAGAIDLAPEPSLQEFDVDPDGAADAIETIVHSPPHPIRWGRITLIALTALFSIAVGLAVDGLIRSLFDRSDWLGWTGIALLVVAAFGLLAIVSRELAGLFRLKRVARLRLEAEQAVDGEGTGAPAAGKAKAVAADLLALYAGRADTARGRRQVKVHLGEVMDGGDLLRLAERDLVGPLDARARSTISASARRVSVVTAVSPRAVIDLVYVLIECLRLIRRLAEIYGGRPGTLGLMRLTRAIVSHLAVTGTMALGDTLIQQVVGHGLAARLSARLGEGVVNGLMTARIGAAAMDVCRPLPFIESRRPRLADLAGDLVKNPADKA